MIFKVSGIKYHDAIFPSEKDYVFLLPEPENIFDNQAVAVYNKFHQRIGYVPVRNYYNEKALKLIHSGNPFVCHVVLSNPSHKFLLIDISSPIIELNSDGSVADVKNHRYN